MTTVPNGFSREELEQMLDAAIIENDVDETPDENLSATDLTNIVMDMVDEMHTRIPTPQLPVADKVLAFMLINHFVAWHTKIGERQLEDGEQTSAVHWLRDAGKFQALGTILSDISFGPEDFTFNDIDE